MPIITARPCAGRGRPRTSSDALVEPRVKRYGVDLRRVVKVPDWLGAGGHRTVDKAHDAVGAIANWGLNWLGTPTLERGIAVAFAKKIPLPGQDQIAATVQSIRIYGVFLCASEGLNIIDECPCFWKLAQDKSKEELESILEDQLDALAVTRQN